MAATTAAVVAEEDTELRDLLVQTLENSGVLNRIKAELRAAVFLALEEQEKVEVKILVEFLIDNCFEIFGENIRTRSRITSDDSLEHTDSSDVSTLQNDSAYDSNDPDVEPTSGTASPNRQLEGPTPTMASLDTRGHRDTCESSSESSVSMVVRLKSSIVQQDRRFSEPNMSPSRECLVGPTSKQKLTRSEDSFTLSQDASCSEG